MIGKEWQKYWLESLPPNLLYLKKGGRAKERADNKNPEQTAR